MKREETHEANAVCGGLRLDPDWLEETIKKKIGDTIEDI